MAAIRAAEMLRAARRLLMGAVEAAVPTTEGARRAEDLAVAEEDRQHLTPAVAEVSVEAAAHRLAADRVAVARLDRAEEAVINNWAPHAQDLNRVLLMN